jgi:hypothetical protein
MPNLKGDLLVVRASFNMQRGELNIRAGQAEDEVSDTIELTLSIAGAAPR